MTDTKDWNCFITSNDKWKRIGVDQYEGVGVMVFNAACKNILCLSVNFIGGGNRRKSQTCCNSLTNLIKKYFIEYTSPWVGFELTTLVVIGTDCIGSYKFNYHTTTMTPWSWVLHKRLSVIRMLNQVNMNFYQTMSELDTCNWHIICFLFCFC